MRTEPWEQGMSDQRDNHHKHIAIERNSFRDKLNDLADSTQRRSKRREDADPYASRTIRGYENTKIDYPDASVLSRPLDLPHSIRNGLLIFLGIAAVIGAIILFRYFDVVVSAPAREAAQVTENVKRHVPYNLPILLDLMPESDAEMMETLSASGDTLFERTPIGTNENGGFQVVKLPEDVSVADAAAIYLAGIDKTSAASASRLLNGAWNLTVTREAPYSVSLRYADFSSGSIENAIQSALLAEDLASEGENAESGVDDSGNTYVTGSVPIDGVTYQWRVSVIPLSEVYDIKGLPDDSLYVGIRLTETDEA